MVSISRKIVLALCLVVLSVACNRKEETPPGMGVGLVFSCLHCEGIKVGNMTFWHKGDPEMVKKREVLAIEVIGDETEADPVIEAQIRKYLAENVHSETFTGGSVLWVMKYCDKVCSNIEITASSELLNRKAGENLADLFQISSEQFIFDKDKVLVGRTDKITSIPEYLSHSPLILPEMSLILKSSFTLLSGISFTVVVTFDDDSTMKGSCTIG